MKTLTLTIPDHIGAAIEAQASQMGRTAADLAAETLSDAFGETDWFYELDDEAKAAILEGMADIERGAVREHEAVFEAIFTKTMTITIPDEIAAAVEEKAAYLGRSAADLVVETLSHTFMPWSDDLTPEEWAEIEKAMEEADRGDLASPAEVEAAFAQFRR